MSYIFACIGLIFLIIIFKTLFKSTKRKQPSGGFPQAWSTILYKNVLYYRGLSHEEQEQFNTRVHTFLLNTKITGIQTSVDDTIRLLVAASAIIPIFKFTHWEYHFLDEVLIYPSAFNLK